MSRSSTSSPPPGPPLERFERLYRTHAPFVWAVARQCSPPAAVDDVVQDVFITAHRRLDELRWEVSPRGWLYGVTRRVAFRYRRSAARTARRAAALADHAPAPDDPYPGHDAARQARELLEQLSPAQRRLIVMAEVLGMSGPEIAAELGIPVNTAYSRIRTVRGRLEALAESATAVDHALAQQRAASRPSETRVQRGWVALVPLLRAPWTPVAASARPSASVAQAIGVAATVSVALVGVLIAAPGSRDSDRAASPPANVADADEPRAPSAPTAPSAVVAPEPSAMPTVVEPTAVPRPPVRKTASARPSPTVRPSPSTPPNTGELPDPVPVQTLAGASTPSSVEEELQLIERARTSLAADRPREALSILTEYARRFPHGTLADAGQATAVKALCESGDRASAREQADALRRAFPRSAIATSLAHGCPEPPP
ncbi:MAG: sigma-70 family RNA polymerase sigma factor [Myxococcota bacterium]